MITQRSKTELLEQLALDPFCAATCARAYFSVDLVEQPAKGAAHTDLHDWAIGA